MLVGRLNLQGCRCCVSFRRQCSVLSQQQRDGAGAQMTVKSFVQLSVAQWRFVCVRRGFSADKGGSYCLIPPSLSSSRRTAEL